MKYCIPLASVLAVLLIPLTPTQAAVSVDYNFRNLSAPTFFPPAFESLDFDAGGGPSLPRATARPRVEPAGAVTTVTNPRVTQGFFGLGVTYSNGTMGTPFGSIPVNDLGSSRIDVFGAKETLELTFSNFNSVSELSVAGMTVALSGRNSAVRITHNGEIVADVPLGFSMGPMTLDLTSLGLTLLPDDVLGFTVPARNTGFALAGLQILGDNGEIINVDGPGEGDTDGDTSGGTGGGGQVTPEPGTLVAWSLLGLTLGALSWRRRRMRRP